MKGRSFRFNSFRFVAFLFAIRCTMESRAAPMRASQDPIEARKCNVADQKLAESFERAAIAHLKSEGYRVTTVGDGPSAMKILDENAGSIDLVILDLMLPGMSGYAVCEALRAGKNDVPVLILSARTLAEDRTRGFDVGADQYLTKPFDLDEFLSRVKNLLIMYARRAERRAEREKALPAQATYEFGDAVVNFETMPTLS